MKLWDPITASSLLPPAPRITWLSLVYFLVGIFYVETNLSLLYYGNGVTLNLLLPRLLFILNNIFWPFVHVSTCWSISFLLTRRGFLSAVGKLEKEETMKYIKLVFSHVQYYFFCILGNRRISKISFQMLQIQVNRKTITGMIVALL